MGLMGLMGLKELTRSREGLVKLIQEHNNVVSTLLVCLEKSKSRLLAQVNDGSTIEEKGYTTLVHAYRHLDNQVIILSRCKISMYGS